MKEKKVNVYVVHGYTSSSSAEWFPWLKNRLAEIGVSTTVFDMPSPNDPNANEWDKYLDENITECSDTTILVGHSLGCITLLRYLEKQSDDKKIGEIILVSGFLEPITALPILDSFVKKNLNIPKLIKMTEKRLVISSLDDSIVPYQLSRELAKQMDAKLITVENGGHFIGQEGFTEFPLIFDELCKIINEYQ